MQQGQFIFGSGQFLFVLLRFNILESRTHIIVIDLELQHFLVAYGIGNDIRMQFTAKHAGCRFCTESVLRKYRRSRKTELIEFFEFLL